MSLVITSHSPEVKEEAKDILIPDIWHIAMAVRRGHNFGEHTEKRNEELSEMLITTWQLCHNLKKHILKNEL